jgi:hypothetical protein
MRNFDAEIAAEIEKENLRFFFLLELQLTTTLRLNDIDINIYHESELFVPRSFSFDSLAGSANLSVESFDIDIDDTDQVMSALLLGEDIRNKIAILYFGVIARTIVAPTYWEEDVDWTPGIEWEGETYKTEMHIQEFVRGIVGGWELYDDNKAKINITNEMVLWNKKCLRPQSSSCPWTFKGTECTYAGAQTWCDQSYDRCTALSNSNQFGGERFMPSVIEKEIWWGRQRGVPMT